MPIQLPKIPCKICKMLFEPTNSGHTMYCGDKCTNSAGNARKKNKKQKFKKNIAILNAMKIPMGQIKTTSQAELEGLGFDTEDVEVFDRLVKVQKFQRLTKNSA